MATVNVPNRLQFMRSTRPHRILLLVALALLFGVTGRAHANMGTPLMWTGACHLVFGNLAIGLVEGWILVRFFQARARRALPLMILANYLSAWIGSLLAGPAWRLLEPADIRGGGGWLLALYTLAWLFTLLVEWPFILLVLRGRLRRSLAANLAAQTGTYALLLLLYWPVSSVSLFTDLEVVPPGEIVAPVGYDLYYVDRGDGDLYRMDLHTRTRVRVRRLGARSEPVWSELHYRKDQDHWELDLQGGKRPMGIGVPAPLLAKAANLEEKDKQHSWPGYLGAGMGPPQSRRCKIWVYDFDLGMGVKEKAGGEWQSFSFTTPFGSWRIDSVFHLPGDTLVLKLGATQLCLLHIPSRRIALLGHGRAPIVLPRLDLPGLETR